MRSELAGARRVVVKIGSSLLTNAGAGLDREAVAAATDGTDDITERDRHAARRQCHEQAQ